MKNALKPLVAALVVAGFACPSAFALVTNRWQDVGGDWNGDWSNPDHWSLGTLPESEQYVAIDGGAGDFTITVNGDYTVGTFELLKPASGVNRITFKGTGSITTTSSSGWSYVRENRPTVFDGVDLTIAGTLSMYNELVLTNGVAASINTILPWLRDPTLHVYDGCTLTCADGIRGSRDSFVVYAHAGSVVSIDRIYRYGSNTDWTRLAIDGGSVTVNHFLSFSANSGATVNSGSLTIKNFDFTTYGATFKLNGGTTTFGPYSSFCAPLRPEWFTIQNSPTINVTAGTTYFLCKEGELPEGATVNAVIPDGLAAGGYMILRGWRDDTLTAAQREAVTLTGATEGWALNRNAGGHVVAWKRGTVGAEGTSTCYEWTGATGDGVFETAANWSNGTATTPATAPNSTAIGVCIGAADKNSISAKGTSVKEFEFSAAAVDTYLFKGTGQITPNDKVFYSYSAVPQHFEITARSTSDIQLRSDGPAAFHLGSLDLTRPVAFKNNAQRLASVRGDIRMRGSASNPADFGIALVAAAGSAPFTRLTVDAGTIVVTNNASVPTFNVAGASIDVETNAMLVYRGNVGATYQWTAAPSDFRINGTFDIQAAFAGGVDQTYGGSGVLKTAEICPNAAGDTALNLTDTLTYAPSRDFVTANGTAPANKMRLYVPSGDPTILLAQDWTYGPGEGTTETSSEDRSLVFNYGTTLTVNAGGHRATFTDHMTGRGTFIVTNGTVRLNFGSAVRTALKVCDSGILEWNATNTFASLDVQPGGMLRPLSAKPLLFTTAQGAATAKLTGSVLEFDGDLVPTNGYLTVLKAQAGITGLPTVTNELFKCSVRKVGGFDELQIRRHRGIVLYIR